MTAECGLRRFLLSYPDSLVTFEASLGTHSSMFQLRNPGSSIPNIGSRCATVGSWVISPTAWTGLKRYAAGSFASRSTLKSRISGRRPQSLARLNSDAASPWGSALD